MKAVLGPTTKASVLGRFFTGLMVLRFFGVIRHWKQMKIRQTHHPTKREGLEKWIPFDHKVKSKKLDVSSLYSRLSCLLFDTFLGEGYFLVL